MFEQSDGMKPGIGTYARKKIKCQPQIWSGLRVPHVTMLAHRHGSMWGDDPGPDPGFWKLVSGPGLTRGGPHYLARGTCISKTSLDPDLKPRQLAR
jgi:hypothetical protein